jgi:hypothetical protein
MPITAIGIDASSNEFEASSSVRILEGEGSWTGSPVPSKEFIAMVEDYEWAIHMTTLTQSDATKIRQGFKTIIKLQKQQTNIHGLVIIRSPSLKFMI